MCKRRGDHLCALGVGEDVPRLLRAVAVQEQHPEPSAQLSEAFFDEKRLPSHRKAVAHVLPPPEADRWTQRCVRVSGIRGILCLLCSINISSNIRRQHVTLALNTASVEQLCVGAGFLGGEAVDPRLISIR